MIGFQESNNRQVVVVTSESTQKQLIATVLKQSNHTIRFVSHFNEIDTITDAIFAVVVFHKVSLSTPKPVVPLMHGYERIIILSDCQIEQHIVAALDQGAHHFFNIRETHQVLVARLHAALRQHDLQIAEYPPYKFRLLERQVEVNGTRVQLNPREFECAHYFFRHNNRVIKTEELMVSVWALPAHLDSRRTDTATCRLRKKLSLDNRENGWRLERVRGIGFRLTNEAA